MATAIKLIGTGIAMGIVHVLTGPDHMSALATLSSSSSSASKCHLFGLGARWGIGHSTGLLVVGGIFVAKDAIQNNTGDDDGHSIEIPELVTQIFESFVGVFMLVLGLYGIWEAKTTKNEYSSVVMDSDAENSTVGADANHNGDEEGDNTVENPSDDTATIEAGNNLPEESGIVHFELEEGNRETESEEFEDKSEESQYSNEAHSEGHDYHHDHSHHHHYHSKSPCLALCAGIFHGLAGPGGVLGVVPAIQLHNAGLATCYLLSFCVSSTLAMGTFASLYGSFVAWLSQCGSTESSQSNVEYWIRVASASLSLLVGVLWLVLLAMGKLEDVFG